MDGITSFGGMRMVRYAAQETGQASQQADAAADTAEHVSGLDSQPYAPLEFDEFAPSQFEDVVPMEFDIDTSLFEDAEDAASPQFENVAEAGSDGASTAGQPLAAAQLNIAPGGSGSNEALPYPSDFDIGAQPSRERNERLLKGVLHYLAADISAAVNRSRATPQECGNVIPRVAYRAALKGVEDYEIQGNSDANCLHFRFRYGDDGTLRMQLAVAGTASEEYIYPEKSQDSMTAGLCLFWAATVAKMFIMGLGDAARSVRYDKSQKLRFSIAQRMLAADPVRSQIYKGRELGARLSEIVVIKRSETSSANPGVFVDSRGRKHDASMLFEVWKKACVERINRAEFERLRGNNAPVYVLTVSGLENIKDQPMPGDSDIYRLHYRFRRNPDGSITVSISANRSGVKTEMIGEATSHTMKPHMLMAWATFVAQELLAGRKRLIEKNARTGAKDAYKKLILTTRWKAYRGVDLNVAFRNFTPFRGAPAPDCSMHSAHPKQAFPGAFFYPSDFDLGAEQSRERNKRLLNGILEYLIEDITEAVNKSRTSWRECRDVIRTDKEMKSYRAALSGFEDYEIGLPGNSDVNHIHFRFRHGDDGALLMQVTVKDKDHGMSKKSEEYIYPKKSRDATMAGLCLFWAAAVAKKFIMGLGDAARSVKSPEPGDLRLTIAERMLAADPVRSKMYRGPAFGKRLSEFIVIKRPQASSANLGAIADSFSRKHDAQMVFQAWKKACDKNLNAAEAKRLWKKNEPQYVSTVSGLENIKDQPMPGDSDIYRLHYRFRRNPEGSVTASVFANRSGVKTEMIGEATSHMMSPDILMTFATYVAKAGLAGKTRMAAMEAYAGAKNLHKKMIESIRWRAWYPDVDLAAVFRHFTPVNAMPAPNCSASEVSGALTAEAGTEKSALNLFAILQEIYASRIDSVLQRNISDTCVYPITVSGLAGREDQPIPEHGPEDPNVRGIHYAFSRGPNGVIKVYIYANRTGLHTEMLGEAVLYRATPQYFLAWATIVAVALIDGETPPAGQEGLEMAANLHLTVTRSKGWEAFRNIDLETEFADFVPVLKWPLFDLTASPDSSDRATILPANLDAIAALCQR